MTGIVGAFGSGPVEARLVQEMAGLLTHRGTAEIRTTSRSVVAGLRRDPATGAGAVIHGEGDLVVLFDGELLTGDPAPAAERVARLYRQHGPAFLDLLDGPFAAVVIDGDRILLARDAVGVRPLFVRHSGDLLLFASEAKALLREPSTVDLDTLLERYVFGDHALGRSTLFRGVQSVAPYQPTPESDHAEIREIVEQNVRYYLERYRMVGVLLSGGFDSSVLACLAQKLSPRPIRTFTIGDSEAFPDVQAARQVARHLGTEHHEFLVDADPDPRDLVHGIHAYEDLSYRDTLFLLARRVAGLADVLLSGSGADLLGTPVLLRPGRLQRVLDNWRRLSVSLREPAERRIAAYMPALLHDLEQDRDAAVLRHFLDDYIPNQLIPSTERAFSYWGMEAAFPFADRRLMRLARQVKTDEERTALLRGAFADLDLPENIKTRPKLCTKRGLIQVKTMLRDRAASASPGNRLGGLLRSEFEARCYELVEAMFLEHRGELSPDLLDELSGGYAAAATHSTSRRTSSSVV